MVHSDKAEAVLFTRKCKTTPVTGLKLFKKEIKVSKDTTVLRLRLVRGAVLWWARCKLKRSKKALDKILSNSFVL